MPVSLRSPRAFRCHFVLPILALLVFSGVSCRRSSSGGQAVVKLRLNEVMGSNQSFPVLDLSGRAVTSDWVEIYNPTAGAVSLAGYSLSDNLNRPKKFEFPLGTVLPARGYLVVFLFSQERCVSRCVESCLADCPSGDTACAAACQEDTAECERECISPVGIVAEINLSATADTLFLFGDNGRRLIDQVGVQSQAANLSNGIDPRTGEYGVMYQPSPGAPNGPAGLKFHRNLGFTPRATVDGQPIEIELKVDRDVLAPGELLVEVEWADLPSRGGFLPPGPLEPALIVRRDTSGEDPVRAVTDRFDLEGNLVSAEVVTLTYFVELPGAPCGTFRGVRVGIADVASRHTIERTIAVCGELDLPTVLVNEYQPEHSSEVGVFFLRTDADPPAQPLGSQDWIEIWNYGDQPVVIAELGLLGGNDLQVFKDGGDFVPWKFGENADKTTLLPGELFCVVADRDRRPVLERKMYRLRDASVGDTTRTFFSTRFRLSPDCPVNATDRVDTFALVDFAARTVLDEVILDFRGERYNCDVRPGQSVGRFLPPEGVEGTTRDALQPGTLTNFVTFERINRLSGEIAPSFRDDVTIESPGASRSPRAGTPVVVRAQINADERRVAGEVEVEMFLEIDPLPTVAVEPELVLSLAVDQRNRAAGAKLYDVTATIPGLVAGTFVVFSYRVKDLVTGATTVYHDGDESLPGRSQTESLRYLVDFKPAVDAPRLNEVLPGANSNTLYPAPYELIRNDFAEIFNPGATPLDLSGYYLTTTRRPTGVEADPPINQVRRFQFPPGTVLAPQGLLPIFFGRLNTVLPAGAVNVEAFALNCEQGEILYLISPVDKEAGANSVVDSIRWQLPLPENPSTCRTNIAVGRLVDGCTASGCIAELRRPTPGAPNIDALLPTLFADAFHQAVALDSPPLGACIDDGPSTLQVLLSASFLVDVNLETALGAGVLTEATFFLDRGRGKPEEILVPRKLSDIFPECPTVGNPVDCVPAPPGYGARVAKLELNFPYDFGAVVRYRVRLVDAAGRVLEAGPFSFATTASSHPRIVINEINRLARIAGDASAAERPWIELHNAGSSEVDLSEMHLTNLAVNLHQARIPDGTRLPPGGFLLVLTDGMAAPPALQLRLDWSHQSTGTLRDLGTLYLVDSFARGSCVIDAVPFDFSELLPGDSLGRDPDGAGSFGKLAAPTPGLPNSGREVFLRGDANGDGKVNVTDMVRLLAILFSGDGRRPTCEDALDTDDNGSINATDVVYIGNFVFRMGPVIPAPFPVAGIDTTPDTITSCSD